MALIHCNFYSHVLDLCMSMDVILPQPVPEELGKVVEKRIRYPVLYLLHGISDDHTIWQRRTSIERYVDPLKLAVVMPTVHRGFYVDMARGPRYGTFVGEELPSIVQAMFPISDKREENFVAGLSMGGYGAFRLAMTYPQRFAAAASLSGAVNIAMIAPRGWNKQWKAEMHLIFGDLKKLPGSANDLFYLAEQLSHQKQQPRLYQWCGTEDFLYQGNLDFRDYAMKLGLDLTYKEDSGEHVWSAWDQQIQRVLEWLPLKK
jgi:putative tributyrin esterase